MTGAPAPQTGLNHGTTGRLYMAKETSQGTVNSVCSATVIASATHDLIATAAHCVWDTRDPGPRTALWFVPGDENQADVAPWGVWTASQFYIRQEFEDGAFASDQGVSGEGWVYDYAFVRLAANDSGEKIEDAVGAQGIAFGIPASNLTVFGYPSVEPFDGLSERYCSSGEWDRYSFGGYSISCTMTPGCSGGGWLTRYDPDRGAGYLVGVTSTGTDVILNAVTLGREALELFELAGGVDDELFEDGEAET
jgi:V8-like Glu-specific endopeptidase